MRGLLLRTLLYMVTLSVIVVSCFFVARGENAMSFSRSGMNKADDRTALLADSHYFATELIQRIERLAEIEPSGRVYSDWQQAAALVRRVRGVLRSEADLERQRAKQRRRQPA